MSDRSIALRRLKVIPDRFRTFDIEAAAVTAEFGLASDVVASLIAEGMPTLVRNDRTYLDRVDLLNVSMALPTTSRQRKVLAWWARELERPLGDAVRYRMDYLVACPDPEHSGPCAYDLLYPTGRRLVIASPSADPHPVGHTVFRLRREFPSLPTTVCDLLDELADVKFLRLPEPVRWDVDFLLATRHGDCCAVAAHLVRRARSMRLSARMAFGRALTPPFTSAHYWAEFLVDGVWTPVDPVFIGALVQWKVLSGRQWNCHSSMGAILGRLNDGPAPIAVHSGDAAPFRLVSYRL